MADGPVPGREEEQVAKLRAEVARLQGELTDLRAYYDQTCNELLGARLDIIDLRTAVRTWLDAQDDQTETWAVLHLAELVPRDGP